MKYIYYEYQLKESYSKWCCKTGMLQGLEGPMMLQVEEQWGWLGLLVKRSSEVGCFCSLFTLCLSAQEPQGDSVEPEDSLQLESIFTLHPQSHLPGFCKLFPVPYFLINLTLSFLMVWSLFVIKSKYNFWIWLPHIFFCCCNLLWWLGCFCCLEPTIYSSSLCLWRNHTFSLLCLTDCSIPMQHRKPWWRLLTETTLTKGHKLLDVLFIRDLFNELFAVNECLVKRQKIHKICLCQNM